MMTSNTLTASANTAGSLFQIFNLPKAGNSSYLFSDIIKVIGEDTEINISNPLLGGNTDLPAAAQSGDIKVIDASKLVNMLVESINSSELKRSEAAGNTSAEQFYIGENDLKNFMNMLGLEKTSSVAKQSSEIEIEITPEFLNKLSMLAQAPVKTQSKHLFISLDNTKEGTNTPKSGYEISTGENGKIKIIFKKIGEEDKQASTDTKEYANIINPHPEKTLDAVAPAVVQSGNELTGTVPEEVTEEVLKIDSAKANAKAEAAGKPAAEQKVQGQGNAEIKLSADESFESVVNKTAEKENKSQLPASELQENKINAEVKGSAEKNTPVSIDTNKDENIDTVENPLQNAVKNVKVKESGRTEISEKPADLNIKSEAKNAVKQENGKLTGEKVTAEMQDSHVKLSVKPVIDKEAAGKEDIQVNHEDKAANTQLKKESAENVTAKGNEDSAVKNPLKGEKIYPRSFPADEILREHGEAAPVKTGTKMAVDKRDIYQVTIEKTEPKNSINTGKDFPQNFYTSDYEEFNTGLFTDKFQPMVKEKQVHPKAEEAVNNTAHGISKESQEQVKTVKESQDTPQQEKQSSGNSNAENHSQPGRQGMKPSAEFVVEHTRPANVSSPEPVNAHKAEQAAREHTFFKSINANELIDEVKSLVVKGDKSNVVLKLNPEHLGSVKLVIDLKDAVLNTKIEVENESVKQVVQNNIENLKQSLQQSGIQLNSLSVSLSSQDQKSSAKPEQKKKGQTVKNDVKIDEEVKVSASKKMGYNTYEYLA